MNHLQKVVPKYTIGTSKSSRKVSIFSLANNINLHRWKILNTPNCNLRDGKHLLNNFPTAATKERYT